MSGNDTERESGLRTALDTEPRGAWPDGVVHHGARVLLLVVVAGLVAFLFPPEERVEVQQWQVGEVADETVTARVGFAVPKDSAELEQERRAARASVPPTFNYRPEVADSMSAELERFFAAIDSAVQSGSPVAVSAALQRGQLRGDSLQVALVSDPESFESVREAALFAARDILRQGVADNAELGEFTTPTVTVREEEGPGRSLPRDEVMSQGDFFGAAVDRLPEGASPDVGTLLRLILINHIRYSLEQDAIATINDQQAAENAVSTVGRELPEDAAIVRAGQVLSPEDVATLNAYRTALENAGLLEAQGRDPRPLVGAWLRNLLPFLIFGLLLYFFRNGIYTDFRWLLLVALLVASYFGVARLVGAYGFQVELLPVAFVALAVAVLWDGRTALVLALILAAVTAVQPPFEARALAVLMTTLVGGAAAALSVRAVRRRAQTWIFIAMITAAYAAVILAQALVAGDGAGDVLVKLGAAAANATFSAILAMGFLPVFEIFTGITTDQTLLEWADPHRPLLKKLSMEANGTYAHTVNVSNLAEAAANVVDANGLLCRVGLLYHDVGKMLKPHYFVENQRGGQNPHDHLKPDTSAAIVKEHVTEGYRIAKEAKVPDVVTDFILQHHGTQRIGFFWEKAKEEYGEENLDIEDFTYPGPKPQSRETAIAMLADSVESATKALQDPTPERVRDLIHSIVDAKIADGQLDEAPLTLREIALIKAQFTKVLSGIYHHRIDYPQTKHLTERPAAAAPAASDGASGDGAAREKGPTVDAAGDDTGAGAAVASAGGEPRAPGRPVRPSGTDDA